jgi:hypothetical protein
MTSGLDRHRNKDGEISRKHCCSARAEDRVQSPLLFSLRSRPAILHLATPGAEKLAEMIGTPRSRVSTFMNKFRKLGFINHNGVLEVHRFC